MLDLMKQYNDSIEKMIKILSLLVGICFDLYAIYF